MSADELERLQAALRASNEATREEVLRLAALLLAARHREDARQESPVAQPPRAEREAPPP